MFFENKSNQIKSSMELEVGGHTQMNPPLVGNSEEKIDIKYGLRENPKKTRRVEDLETPHLMGEQKQMICKKCGKGFKSMKALCGHMACHSEKDRFFKDDYWTCSVSETAESGRKRPKRVGTKKCKNAQFCGVLNNDSSSVSGIDFEQEEVAMCLIMLSRDYKNWFGVGSNQESSDSVVLEAKSASIDMKIGQKRDRKCVYECMETEKLAKGKWESGVSDSENEESTDGYFETNGFRKQKSGYGSRVELYDAELGKNLKNDECGRDGLGNGSDSKIMKFVSKNKTRKAKHLKSKKKTKAHECPYCNRVFDSGQALGGHKRIHSLGNYGNRDNLITTVFEAETYEMKDMLDLNLPATEEEEKSENSQFVNW